MLIVSLEITTLFLNKVYVIFKIYQILPKTTHYPCKNGYNRL